MSLQPYKFIIQAVAQQIDDNGDVTGEATLEPVIVYGCDRLAEWATAFPDRLASLKEPE